MADNNPDVKLDPGFEETSLDKGFDPVPLSDSEKNAVTNYLSKSPSATSGQALREGFAEGGTFGFAPRVGAVMGTGMEKLAGSNQSLSDLYNEYLNYNNKLQENAKASHPGMYYTGALAGGLVSPLNKIGGIGLGSETMEAANAAEKAVQAGQAVRTASIPTNILLGGLGGAKVGALGGLSQSKDLTDIKQDLENAGMGATLGYGIGGASVPAMSALKGATGVTKNLFESFFGPVPKTIGQGFQAGIESAPNLATSAGQAEAQQGRTDFAKDFVNKLRDIVKSNAKNKVQMIQQHAADLPKDQVDNVLNQILEMDPAKMGTKEAEEFGQIKEEILRAKEGPMTTETVRQYNPGAAPISAINPNAQFRPPINPAETLPPEGSTQAASQAPLPGQDVTPAAPQQLGPGGLQNPPVPQQQPVTGQAENIGLPPESTPNQFAGYEAIHKATIDADDNNARKLFAQKIQEKLIDEEKLGKNDNNNPVQIEEEPIPGTDKVRLIAKRAIESDEGDEFKEQAQNLTQQQKDAQRLQALLDKQNEESAKLKQQQEIEMAKPQFQDIQQDVRAGGRNIQNPQELYNLQQLMQEYGNPANPRMSTQGMQRVARDASTKLAQVLKQNIGTSNVDDVIHAFNNIGEVMNIDPSQLKLPGGVGESARENALSQVFKLINPENLSDNDILNNEKIGYIADQLKTISPELSNTFVDSVEKQAQTKGLIKEFTKPYEPTGINPALNVVRRNVSKLGYNVGYNIGEEISKYQYGAQPYVQAGRNLFNQYTPQSLQNMASRAALSGDASLQQFGQTLTKLANADERTRNSMIFILEQQAPYRAMMQKLMGPEQESPGEGGRKNKELQLYK